MRTRVERITGSSGEASPLLYGRTDLSKQQASDKHVVNFTVLPEGARTRTPGTLFVDPYRNETRPARLFGFEAGENDAYMLAFNDDKMRVYKNQQAVFSGPTRFELNAPFTDEELNNLFFAQSRSVIFMASGARPKRLTRASDVAWELVDYESVKGPVRLQNADPAKTLQASGNTGAITLSANFDAFLAGHVGSTWRLDETDLSTIPAWKAIESPAPLGMRRRYKGRIYEVVSLNSATGDTGPNPPEHDEGDVFSSGGNVTWRFICASTGYVKITGFTDARHVTALVTQRLPDSIVAGPTYRWFEAAWSDVRGWPRTVSIVDQSLLWTRANEFWLSQASDIYSFDETDSEDPAISGLINGPDGKLVDIRWSLPAGVIVFGARSGEWLVRGAGAIYERLSATNARAIPQGSKGSAPAQPVMTEGGAVYIGKSRRKLHFAKFDAVSEQIEFQDFMNYARHQLRSGAYQLAFQPDPYDQIWVRRGDGTLAGVTFKPDEEVIGHHNRTFHNGFCEQIAAVQSSDDSQTEVWMGVRRVINGQTRRYIEVMQPYFESDDGTAKGAWFLDCALKYDGAAATEISGLGHLEGQEVCTFIDGRMGPKRVVTGAKITLPSPRSDVLIGLPIPARIKALPFNANTQKGPTWSNTKSSSFIALRVHEAQGGKIWTGVGEPSEIHSGGPFSAPAPLTSGVITVSIDKGSDYDIEPELMFDDAFPFTLLAMMPELDVGDS